MNIPIMKIGEHVTSELTEKDLLDNGFSSKQLSRLKEVLSRNENAGETLSTLVDDLSKRFYGGVICLMLILAPLIVLPIFYTPSLLIYYLPVAVFGVIAVWYLIPLGLSWKAHTIMKGR
ncbi:hypothetical protein [Enterobacter mori]|uniref:hypothetical protein n=1 Tax=Enterobacter mori TaxID=539813 RepID=UPI001CF6F38B|nr:hypothetical protein [Enterobacter mori]MCW4989067.1 hypothetical protein [Enterobacter mori]MDF2526427.1 hypothetical protein [Enterobacter mori]UCT07840.1 hypothetical protein K6742_01600 [Enterobacter mori]